MPPPEAPQQQAVLPFMEAQQQQVPITNRAGGGIICANCGSAIIPVKSEFGCGFLLLFGVFYLIYHAFKRADHCPVCGKNAYVKEVQVTKTESKPNPVSKKVVLIVVISVVGLLALFISLANYMSNKPITLNAAVSFEGNDIVVSNKDDCVWLDVTVTLNSDYTFHATEMKNGMDYLIDAKQFTTRYGGYFNLATTKPKNISISCKTTKGQSATWSQDFK